MDFEDEKTALASVAQLVGSLFRNQEVVGPVPGQDTYLGCGFNPWSGHVREAAC